MAGIKITDLTALTTAEATDYLCIVDVSDTSQSPAGTTKKIELGNVATSGTWNPTLDGVDGACSNVSLLKAQYSRVGNIVNCSINGEVDLDFTSNPDGHFNFTYPFAPSSNNSIGVVSKRGNANDIVTGYVRFNEIWFDSAATTDLGQVQFFAIFQYEID
jgi:hypothetical protein